VKGKTSSTCQLQVRVNVNCRYVSVLVELTRIEGTKHGRLIASQMLDVAIRVQAIRGFIVSQMVRLTFKRLLCLQICYFIEDTEFH